MESKYYRLDTPVTALSFSEQTMTALQRTGISNIGMLLAAPEPMLMEMHGLNTKRRAELKATVENLNLTLEPTAKELFTYRPLSADNMFDHLALAYLHRTQIYTVGELLLLPETDLDVKLNDWYPDPDQDLRKQAVKDAYQMLKTNYQTIKEKFI